MRDSVPSASYSSVCNVLRQWNIPLIPTYRVYRLYDYIDYCFFRLHIYVISKWLLTQLSHTLTAIARVSPYVHSTCTSYVLKAYLYCVYALVGGAISIRDPYICAVSRVWIARCLPQARCLCNENVAIGFKPA